VLPIWLLQGEGGQDILAVMLPEELAAAAAAQGDIEVLLAEKILAAELAPKVR